MLVGKYLKSRVIRISGYGVGNIIIRQMDKKGSQKTQALILESSHE